MIVDIGLAEGYNEFVKYEAGTLSIIPEQFDPLLLALPHDEYKSEIYGPGYEIEFTFWRLILVET